MTIQNFELELKQLDENLSIRPAPVSDVVGIYYKDFYICTCPADEIFEEIKPEYKDALGNTHHNKEMVIAKVQGWLKNKVDNIETEEWFAKNMNKKEPRMELK